jgi:hypothetical protein
MALFDNEGTSLGATLQSKMLPIRFSQSDLNASHELIIQHNRGTVLVIPHVMYSPDGIKQDEAGIFQIVDDDQCKITFGGDLPTGNHLYIIEFINKFEIV